MWNASSGTDLWGWSLLDGVSKIIELRTSHECMLPTGIKYASVKLFKGCKAAVWSDWVSFFSLKGEHPGLLAVPP